MLRRLFVIWTSPIFRDSVQLLLDHPEIEWLGATSDYASAPKDIRVKQADTIVIEQVGSGLPVALSELLDTESDSARVICVSLDENQVRVYSRENWTVAEAGNLLQLVLQVNPQRHANIPTTSGSRGA